MSLAVASLRRQAAFECLAVGLDAQLNAWKSTRSKLTLPQGLPHGRFCTLLSVRQDEQKFRKCGAFVK